MRRIASIVLALLVVASACVPMESGPTSVPAPTAMPSETLMPGLTTTPGMPSPAVPTPTSVPAPTATMPTTRTEPVRPSSPQSSFVIATDYLGTEGLDPSLGPSTARFYYTLLYDDLVGAANDGSLSQKNGVAKSWVFGTDGKTLTYTLREGLKFQDGKEITAEDVKFSIEHVMEPESRASFSSTLRGLVSRVEVPDSRTVVLYHRNPTTLTLNYLGPMSTESMVIPKHYVESVKVQGFQRNPMGSGPFQLKKQVLGSRLDLAAAQQHSGLRTPAVASVTFLLVPEETTRKAVLRTGLADFARISRDSVTELRNIGFPTVTGGSGVSVFLGMHLQADGKSIAEDLPIGDIRVRKAMSLAINRQELASILFGGFAEPATAFRTYGPVLRAAGRSLAGFSDSFDPEGAKRLLKEAGYPERWRGKQRIAFYAHPREGVPEWRALTEVMAESWRGIGLEINYLPGDFSVWRSRWTAQTIPGAVVILAGAAGFSWPEQLIGYNAFMFPELPRALMWDMKMKNMLQRVGEASDDAVALKRIVEVAEYSHVNYLPGFSIVELRETYGLTKRLSPWTARPLPYALGDFQQVVVK